MASGGGNLPENRIRERSWKKKYVGLFLDIYVVVCPLQPSSSVSPG